MWSAHTQVRSQGSGAFVPAHPAHPKWHAGQPCFSSSRSPFEREKREGNGKQIPETLAGKQKVPLPEPQRPVPDATHPLESHVKAPKVTQWWQQNDQGQGREGRCDWGRRLAGKGMWADLLWNMASMASHNPECKCRECDQG